jgi:Ice-binding-like
MEVAFVDAAGRIPQVTEHAGGIIGGMTLAPGSYYWSSGVAITQDVTLAGDATDVWIFQIAQSFTMTAGTHVVLTGGALAKNVFWQISGGPVTLAANADLQGIVLTQTAVTLAAGATVHGRVLAQTAVDVDGSTVIAPAL